MKAFRNFAFISTVTSYLLIFTGGLVRVSGAGLGCPDWPKCFGRWLPPLSMSQLPTDVDPNTFNFALAWIEYLNRLFGMLLGLLVVVTAILAIIHYRRVLRILLPTFFAALCVAFAGWQGGKVVTSHLEPLSVSFHLIVALAVVTLLTCYDDSQVVCEFTLWFSFLPVGSLVYSSLWREKSLQPAIRGFPTVHRFGKSEMVSTNYINVHQAQGQKRRTPASEFSLKDLLLLFP